MEKYLVLPLSACESCAHRKRHRCMCEGELFATPIDYSLLCMSGGWVHRHHHSRQNDCHYSCPHLGTVENWVQLCSASNFLLNHKPYMFLQLRMVNLFNNSHQPNDSNAQENVFSKTLAQCVSNQRFEEFLAVGCQLLAAGCSQLLAGCWLRAVGCCLLAAGCLVLAACCRLLFAGSCLLAASCRILDFRASEASILTRAFVTTD